MISTCQISLGPFLWISLCVWPNPFSAWASIERGFLSNCSVWAGVTCRTKEWIKHWTSGTCAYNQFDCLSVFFSTHAFSIPFKNSAWQDELISFSHSYIYIYTQSYLNTHIYIYMPNASVYIYKFMFIYVLPCSAQNYIFFSLQMDAEKGL